MASTSTAASSTNTNASAVLRRDYLKLKDLPQSEIARKVGCDKALVSRVFKEIRQPYSPDELQTFQEDKAQHYDVLQHKILRSIDEAKIEKMPAASAVLAICQLEDKARLVRGQATSLNVTALLDVADMLRAKG